MKEIYDVAIVGGGPAGCLSALAFAQRGARTLLLEANPRAAYRLAGEWIHPPAVEAMEEVGLGDYISKADYATGKGFAVFPEDGSAPIVLPYAEGTRGFSFEHHEFVEALRSRVRDEALIDLHIGVRVTRLEESQLTIQNTETKEVSTVLAGRIIGADGRHSSVSRKALGLESHTQKYSRMAGVLLDNTEPPVEGHGHVFLGGPGPVLGYTIAPGRVRLCLDVPMDFGGGRPTKELLYSAYSKVFPSSMHAAFRRSLENISWAVNEMRARTHFGTQKLTLIGDAAGHFHPFTAAGMTLGFGDAIAVARLDDFETYRKMRPRQTRVAELLAVALYDVFARQDSANAAMRQAVYKMWRNDPAESRRTMAYLAGQDADFAHFGRSFLKTMLRAGGSLASYGLRERQLLEAGRTFGQMAGHAKWLVSSTLAAL